MAQPEQMSNQLNAWRIIYYKNKFVRPRVSFMRWNAYLTMVLCKLLGTTPRHEQFCRKFIPRSAGRSRAGMDAINQSKVSDGANHPDYCHPQLSRSSVTNFHG